MECEYCKTKFASNASLENHKLKAKYCLKIQGKLDFKCEYCEYILSSKQSLDRHVSICNSKETKKELVYLSEVLKEKNDELSQVLKEKTDTQQENKGLKDELHKKEIEIAELKTLLNVYKDSQECLKEIAKQPKITTTNNTNNTKNNNMYVNMPIFNLSKDTIEDKVKNNFTKSHLNDGQNGVADFAFNNLLKDEDKNLMYICTDPSRNMFAYKTEDGTIEKDFKANKLAKLLTEDVIKKATSLSDDSLKSNIKLSEIREMRKDNSKFSNKLSSLLYKTGELDLETDSESEYDERSEKEESDLEEYTEKLKRFDECNKNDDGFMPTYLRNQLLKKIEEKQEKINM